MEPPPVSGALLVEPSGNDLAGRVQRLAGAGIEQFVVEDNAVEAVNEALAGSPALLGLVISFSLRPQPDNGHVLVKADRLVRTAGEPRKTN